MGHTLSPSSPTVPRSRHRIAPFRFLRATSFAEARSLLDEWPGSMPIAGGLDLVNQMKEGLNPGTLVWLGGIPAADAVRWDGTDLVIGAGCSHDQVAQSQAVWTHLPDLAAAWSQIATIRIRSQGTIAGNLMARNAGYEVAILLKAMGGQLSVLAPGGRDVTVAAFQLGDACGGPCPPPGLVTQARVRGVGHGRRRHLYYDRTLRPALSVALGIDVEGEHITAARAVLGGCHVMPVLRDLPLAGLHLRDLKQAAGEVARAAFTDLPPFPVPWRGVPDYRERMASVLLRRLIEGATR